MLRFLISGDELCRLAVKDLCKCYEIFGACFAEVFLALLILLDRSDRDA